MTNEDRRTAPLFPSDLVASQGTSWLYRSVDDAHEMLRADQRGGPRPMIQTVGSLRFTDLGFIVLASRYDIAGVGQYVFVMCHDGMGWLHRGELLLVRRGGR